MIKNKVIGLQFHNIFTQAKAEAYSDMWRNSGKPAPQGIYARTGRRLIFPHWFVLRTEGRDGNVTPKVQ